MDEQGLRTAGLKFRVGEDLYGISVAGLEERIDTLSAEIERVQRILAQKSIELSSAEDIFKK